MKKCILTISLLSLSGAEVCASEGENIDSISKLKTLFNSSMFKGNSTDSLVRERHKKTFFHQVGNVFTRFFREFDTIDSSYIEPQHYNFTVMLQNTNTYEQYSISSKDGQGISFAPDPTFRVGPYLGWRWVFLGYTLDVKSMFSHSSTTKKKEFGLSLYSSMIGVDLYWRETGNDYHIKRAKLIDGSDVPILKKVPFDGLKSSIKGVNFYYIFNHRRFSYPAAYSQSTVQRKSAGSWLLGLGVTKHTLEFDWEKMNNLMDKYLGEKEDGSSYVDESLIFSKVKYTDVSVTCGYAYNWVFAKNWLFNASLSLGLAYNQSDSDTKSESTGPLLFRDFNFKNINMDGVGRFGIVWNNTKWYAGANSIIHSYNYKQDQFSTNNSFGYLNVYVGVNFGRKRGH